MLLKAMHISCGELTLARELWLMLGHLLRRLRRRAGPDFRATRRRLARWTRPASSHALVLGATADLLRSRSALIAENALLRHQLIVLSRSAKRPASPGSIAHCSCG